MLTVNTRENTLFVVEQDNPGVLKFPTAGTEVVATQGLPEITPEIENLDNEETLNSLLSSESTPGKETVTFSTPHYFKAGTAGQLPQYGLYMKSALGGVHGLPSETTIAVATSRTEIELADATGYIAGGALLVQSPLGNDPRPIKSVSGNVVTLDFPLSFDPQVGQSVSGSIHYYLKNNSDDMPLLSIHNYMPGQLKSARDVRIENMEVEFPAGERITGDFSGSGTKFYLNPIDITASNKVVSLIVAGSSLQYFYS